MAEPSAPRLAGLLGAEGLRIVNDNLVRVVAILLLIGPHEAEEGVQAATAHVQIFYTAPWVALSLHAGLLADRMSKRTVLRGLKLAEVAVMLMATAVLAFGDPAHGPSLALLAVVALVGTLTAGASPSKYGILPEILPPARLSYGNGQMLLWTYLAMITGTALGGPLLDLLRAHLWIIGCLLVVLALVGYALSARIPTVPAARAAGGLRATLRRALGACRQGRRLRVGLVANVAYWALSALLLQVIVTYAKASLDLSDTRKGLLLTAAALGIGLGGLAAGATSRGRIRLGYVPVAAAAMAVLMAGFGWLAPAFPGAFILLVALGLAAGFYIVPLNALVQHEAPTAARGAVLALMNVLTFLGIGVGSGAAWGLAGLGLASTEILVLTGAAAALGAAFLATVGRRLFAPGA